LDAQEDYLNILTELGLTIRQADVYISVLKSNQATVKIIAHNAKVERAEVYRVIPVLEKLGLIKKFISKPITYEGISIPEGLIVLLERDTNKHNEIQVKANKLIKKICLDSKEDQSHRDIHYFLASGAAERLELIKILNTVQSSLDVIIDWRSLQQVVSIHYKLFKEALDRGVKIRYITRMPKDAQDSRPLQNLKKGTFEVKYSSSIPPNTVVLIDEKDIDIVTMTNSTSTEVTGLWSNNPNLVATIRDYFDLKWNLATDSSPK
jgi:sugar-specific transcriptional regulator TrmB